MSSTIQRDGVSLLVSLQLENIMLSFIPSPDHKPESVPKERLQIQIRAWYFLLNFDLYNGNRVLGLSPQSESEATYFFTHPRNYGESHLKCEWNG